MRRALAATAILLVASGDAARAQPAPTLGGSTPDGTPPGAVTIVPDPQRPPAGDPSPTAASPSAPDPAGTPLDPNVLDASKLPPKQTLTDVHDAATLGMFLGGGALGFLAHESGHLVTNFAYGNTPQFVRLTAFGFIPFFAIASGIGCDDTGTCYKRDGSLFAGGREGKYVIVTAGFDVQHITTELILSLEPQISYKRAPFQKGVLAFDILVSVGYAVADWTRTENIYGDAGTAAQTAGIERDIFAGLVIAPALLDTYRFLRPQSKWVPYASRGAKLTMLGITFAL